MHLKLQWSAADDDASDDRDADEAKRFDDQQACDRIDDVLDASERVLRSPECVDLSASFQKPLLSLLLTHALQQFTEKRIYHHCSSYGRGM